MRGRRTEKDCSGMCGVSLQARLKRTKLALAVLPLVAACATLPTPDQVVVPVPRSDNQGEYLSPYTSDSTVAPWVRKARAAALGSAIGKEVGTRAGTAALSSVPVFGGLLGRKAGDAAGRAAALALVGGEEALREGSDLSFDRAEDLAVFLYAYAPSDTLEIREKPRVVSLTWDLYPRVRDRWEKAIKKARKPKE